MKLLRLELEHFRNHGRTTLECSLTSNVFLGDNGEGKTNILEAISFLCLTKSFYAATDGTTLQIGEEMFRIRGELESDSGVRYDVQIAYDGTTSVKRMLINKAPVETLASVVGEFPIVVLSPENSAVTFGGPGDRRKFIDLVVSQSSKSYLEDLLEYRKVLRQRNKILSDARQTRTDCSTLLEPWNEGLAQRGARIIRKRARFVAEFQPLIDWQFGELVGKSESPHIAYECGVPDECMGTAEDIQRFLDHALADRYADERRLGSTLVGPHRDELAFSLNGLELRRFASQGQHKTFLVALKLAEFFYLRDRCRENPLLLLDDVLSELDERRSAKLLHETSTLGQTFITTTDDHVFRHNASVPYQRYVVTAGRVSNGETIAAAG